MSGDKFRSGHAHFLVDTGADINVIKFDALFDDIIVALDESATLSGITSGTSETLGTTFITLQSEPIRFHVVKSCFPI